MNYMKSIRKSKGKWNILARVANLKSERKMVISELRTRREIDEESSESIQIRLRKMRLKYIESLEYEMDAGEWIF